MTFLAAQRDDDGESETFGQYRGFLKEEKEIKMKEMKKENKMKMMCKKMKVQVEKLMNAFSQKRKELTERSLRWAEGKRGQVVEKLSCSQGISTIEIILILVVLIALIIIFRDRLMALINSIFETITSESGSV